MCCFVGNNLAVGGFPDVAVHQQSVSQQGLTRCLSKISFISPPNFIMYFMLVWGIVSVCSFHSAAQLQSNLPIFTKTLPPMLNELSLKTNPIFERYPATVCCEVFADALPETQCNYSKKYTKCQPANKHRVSCQATLTASPSHRG